MTIAPLLFVDGLIGFRVSEGLVTLNLSCIRGEWRQEGAEPPKMAQIIQPAVDLVVPIPALQRIIDAIQENLSMAQERANLEPHPTKQ